MGGFVWLFIGALVFAAGRSAGLAAYGAGGSRTGSGRPRELFPTRISGRRRTGPLS
jgi:hypothetical protein